MKQRFFKQDGKWYADVANHTLEDNEMVMGADIALEIISEGHNEVTLDLSTEPLNNEPLLLFIMKEHDDNGAYYSIGGSLYMQHITEILTLFNGFVPELWICNVTHDVFGEHPNSIFVNGIYF